MRTSHRFVSELNFPYYFILFDFNIDFFFFQLKSATYEECNARSAFQLRGNSIGYFFFPVEYSVLFLNFSQQIISFNFLFNQID